MPEFKRTDDSGTEWVLSARDGRARIEPDVESWQDASMDRATFHWLIVVAGPALLPHLSAAPGDSEA